MGKLNKNTEELIWALARKDAKEKLGEAYLTEMPEEFLPKNPFVKDTLEWEEYEVAFEHYVMTGLGY
jgi:hypothetical protein